jgi:hypothetical protein
MPGLHLTGFGNETMKVRNQVTKGVDFLRKLGRVG